MTDLRSLLGDDGHALLALCSPLGMEPGDGEAPAPLVLSEWNDLARRIQASTLKRPAALRGRSPADLVGELDLPPDLAGRIATLLARGGRLAFEIDRLCAAGLWIVTRADSSYPARLRETLRHQAPPVLFGAGEPALLRSRGVAVVGSRAIDDAGARFARALGARCAEARIPVVSGGARGTDRLAMQAALDAGGSAFGVLADSLERTARQADVREWLLQTRLVLLTPYVPSAGFSVGAAMGRNKIVYGLADRAVIVSSEFEKGGTWAGAVEALKGGWCPVFVRDGPAVPSGNTALRQRGAIPLSEPEVPTPPTRAEAGKPGGSAIQQLDLFGA